MNDGPMIITGEIWDRLKCINITEDNEINRLQDDMNVQDQSVFKGRFATNFTYQGHVNTRI